MDKVKLEETLIRLHETATDKSVASVLLQELREAMDTATATIEQIKKQNEEVQEANRKLENVNRDLFLRLPTQREEKPAEQSTAKKGIESLFE